LKLGEGFVQLVLLSDGVFADEIEVSGGTLYSKGDLK